MKAMLFAVLGASLLFLAPPVTHAQSCSAVCGAAKRTCQTGAAAAFHQCRLDAHRQGRGMRRAQRMQCLVALHDAAKTCVASLQDCLHKGCQPPPGSCRYDCGQTAVACVKGVVSDGHSCTQACAPGRGRLQCLLGCASRAGAGFGMCRVALSSCLTRCPSSPSGAFVDPASID